MPTIKIKFRPSTIEGKEGSLFYQIIHKRVVRQIRRNCSAAIQRQQKRLSADGKGKDKNRHTENRENDC